MSWEFSEEEWESRWRNGQIGKDREASFFGMQHNDDEHMRFGLDKSKKETCHAGKKEEEKQSIAIHRLELSSVKAVVFFLVLLESCVLQFLFVCLL